MGRESLGRRGVGALFLALLAAGCTRTLDLEVALTSPESPDPFVGVSTVRLSGVLRTGPVVVGEGRWDQGPLPFPGTLDARIRRLVVEGLDADGALVASGVSPPLDLLTDPPEGRLELLFTRVGALSRVGDGGAPRDGAGLEALGLPDGRVLFAGGRRPDGCPEPRTEVLSAAGWGAGPLLGSGRAGRLTLVALPDGAVLAVGGEDAAGCADGTPAQEALRLDPDANTTQTFPLDAPVPAGAGVAAVDASLVVLAGGEGASTYPATVVGLDPGTGESRVLGALDGPRAHAAVGHLGGGRVLLAGGRSAAGAEPLADASVFVARRGAALSTRVPLATAVARSAAAVTPAGNMVLVGGERGAEGVRAVQSIAVGLETSTPLGDTSLLTALTASVGAARAVALGDASLLVLPEAGGDPQWVRLLPLGSARLAVPGGASGALVGGVGPDGRAWLRDPAGARFVFDPGPASVLGPAAYGDRLVLDSARPPRTGLGLWPLRASSWQLTTEGLEARAPERATGRQPSEWAVLSEGAVGDFELEVELRLGVGSQAALLFGLADGEHDHVTLVGSAAVGRSEGRSQGRPVACASAATPSLTTPRMHTVRLTRVGEVVELDVDADGTVELSCALTGAPEGYVGVGVVTGQVTFGRVRLTALD